MSFHRHATAFAATALVLCLAAAGSAAGATPGEISRFPVRHLCFQSAIAAAPHGGVLARTCEGQKEVKLSLVNVMPSGEVVRLAAVESPTGPEVAGADGEIWAVENFLEFPSPPPGVDRIAPDGTVSHFSVPSGERGE